MRILFVLLLAGCASQPTPEQMADTAIKNYGAYCEKFGFKRDTPEWVNCVMTEERAKKARDYGGTTCRKVGNTTVCN